MDERAAERAATKPGPAKAADEAIKQRRLERQSERGLRPGRVAGNVSAAYM